MAGTNLMLSHCRRDDCTSKGGYDHEERLLDTSAGDVAESIRKSECGSVVVDTISPSCWKRDRVG